MDVHSGRFCAILCTRNDTPCGKDAWNALVNERRNIGREVLEKKWLGELEKLENRLIKFAIGFAGTTALVWARTTSTCCCRT